MTLGELDVEISDQGVDVVVALDLQAEGRGEGQVLCLHRVNVHFLENKTKQPNKQMTVLSQIEHRAVCRC